MIIGVDHGNAQINTKNHAFVTGITEHMSKPPLGEVLFYKDKYYTLSSKRISYHRDKTKDSRFLILTLFAIAKELPAGIHEADIDLVVGLPPAHFNRLAKDFKEYFLRLGPLCFAYKEISYQITIKSVGIYPQCYSAIVAQMDELVSKPKALIIDIGGYTVDYLQLNLGKPEMAVCGSLESGVITFFNDMVAKVNSEYDLLIEESDIQAVLLGKETVLERKMTDYIREQSKVYIKDLMSKFRELQIDLKTFQVVFVGGGSILLKNYLLRDTGLDNALFVMDDKANASGYEYLYQMALRR